MTRFALLPIALCLMFAALRGDEPAALNAALAAAKPLALDIAFGETDYLFREVTDPATGAKTPVITDNFYYHSTRAKIDLAGNDLGKVTLPGKVDIAYRLVPAAEGRHRLTVALDFNLKGREDLVRTLELPLDQWAVHSFLDYKTSWGDQRYFYVAVRLGPAGAPTPLARED